MSLGAMTLRGALPAVMAALLGCSNEPDPMATCPPPSLELPDGSCIRPGIAPDRCAPGFAHDGEYGCAPVLPEEPCAPGLMAIPGETECRPVAPCGEGKWGDIPVDATTVYVDAQSAGGDGSAAAPFQRIADAYALVAPGGLVAIADGEYAEDLFVSEKPARFWGRCPERVRVRGLNPQNGVAIQIRFGAGGSELHALAVTGPAVGVAVGGAEAVLLDRVWVHDTGLYGVLVQRNLGSGDAPASLHLVGSLIEGTDGTGVSALGTELTIEGSAVRRILPGPDGDGRGVNANLECAADVCDPTRIAQATIRNSVVESTVGYGIYIAGSLATIEATVVRDVLPAASNPESGRGIGVQDGCNDHQYCSEDAPSDAVIRGSVIERHHEVGLHLTGSTALVETTVVRGHPDRASPRGGIGILIEAGCRSPACTDLFHGSVAVRSALVDQSHHVGVAVAGNEATLESVVVRETRARLLDGQTGRGLSVQPTCTAETECNPDAPAQAALEGSLIELSDEVGILVAGSDATITSTIVRNTRPRPGDGLFGDGISVLKLGLAPARATLSLVRSETSARAGLSIFDASASIATSTIQCAAFAIDLEGTGQLVDQGGSLCGCPEANGPCKAVSAGLAPPEIGEQ